MAESFRPENNFMQSPAPGRTLVKIDANVKIELGNMVDTVAGFGRVPAAADTATGRMRGIAEDTVDNTGGAQGAKSVSVRPMVSSFKNSVANPCAQANVGALVYAEDGQTVGTVAGSGVKAGTLIEFNANDPLGLPCKVALLCDTP